jgi:diguanylate cyclase (GGDEF)-like protein
MKHINTDPLTKLPSTVAFDEAITESFHSNGGDGRTPVSIALFDVDHFLEVNKTYGHEQGDKVLIELAALFSAIDEGATTYRIGGDEFAVLMNGFEKEPAFLRLESARDAFSKLESLGGINPSPTISVGVATYPDDGTTRQEVIRKANDALFRAKTAGRNRVALAREEKKVPKTSHYTQGQLERLGTLSKKEGVGEAELLREALDDLLKKYSS